MIERYGLLADLVETSNIVWPMEAMESGRFSECHARDLQEAMRTSAIRV